MWLHLWGRLWPLFPGPQHQGWSSQGITDPKVLGRGPRVATPRATGSPGRQQVALHCHQHVWHCPVTAGDAGMSVCVKGAAASCNPEQ